MPNRRRSGAGLCILRIEPHDTQFLITVRMRSDLRETSGEHIYHTVDADAAVRLVRSFLLDFASTDGE